MTRILAATVLVMAAAGGSGAAERPGGRASVAVVDERPFVEGDAAAVAGLARARLLERGVDVVDGGAVDRVLVFRGAGTSRARLLLTVEERGDGGRLVHSASLSANDVDEWMTVVPRLVDAVLDGVPGTETARYRTVTRDESKEPVKKGGESLWVVGVPLSTPGLTFARMWQADRYRLSLGFDSTIDETAFIGAGIGYVAGGGEFAPYAEVTVGLLLESAEGTSREGSGDERIDQAAVRLELGVEALRLNRFRLIAGPHVTVPMSEGSPRLGVSARIGF